MINTLFDSIINSITYSRLFITFEAINHVELPPYKGATFRGCMGHAFRKLVCKYPGRKCEKCRIESECLFALMYSKPLTKDHPAFGKYTLPPRPYIINPSFGVETDFPPGSRFGFELILIGSIVSESAPLLPSLFMQMGEEGIGKERGKFRPVRLQHMNGNGEYKEYPAFGTPFTLLVADLPQKTINGSVTLIFENPLRLLSDRKPMADTPEFKRFAESLSIRIALLANIYCSAPWQDINHLNQLKSDVTIEYQNLKWVNWRHFSGTKQIGMNFDGHTGSITYKGNLSPWAKLLTAGEILHAGSTATFGLGKYHLM